MSFTCDLVDNAKRHKWFLEKLHDLGVTFATSSAQSLYRYQHLWLPLVYKHPKEQLIPPPDVAWLWHCHRLAPKDYVAYINQTFRDGGAVEANPPFALQIRGHCGAGSVAQVTQEIWMLMYPDEPFFLDDVSQDSAGRIEGKRDTYLGPLCGFDLLASTERQATFLWQVSGERFQDDDFLEEGVENYTKFLKLKQKASQQRVILVPTYQIDLLWHTHILSSVTNYNTDCKAIMGSTLHHDDSLTDRSDGGVLDVAYKSTKNLWKEEYGCDYVICGGMYRGEPPKEFFAAEWRLRKQEWNAGANLHLVGKMGASSTSPPIKWADPAGTGTTSEGLPAFIATNTRMKSELMTKERKDDYVLGKTANGTGYFHLETKDAQEILFRRVDRQMRALESEIACDQCCCELAKNIKSKEDKLDKMKEVRSVLAARMTAARPSGEVRNPPGRNIDDTYYGNGGVWLYPAFVYDSAGGACGGTVVCNGAGGCGGSACGGRFDDSTHC
jgi:hypothetical protein